MGHGVSSYVLICPYASLYFALVVRTHLCRTFPSKGHLSALGDWHHARAHYACPGC